MWLCGSSREDRNFSARKDKVCFLDDNGDNNLSFGYNKFHPPVQSEVIIVEAVSRFIT